ncbi:MAG TPA: hypothetical protein VKR55_04875 [Bradyrhizobium sp.]|uniref:hypothetical protein n=1 Tax=Bradyrhizobium sp. TaxID=376 RepID=UPI002C4A47EC|nr:hypothetical protein [Bradyrhizobium sp.]HLZ01469.1 hypothetical protein [Bradyrhizobium sp.]
MMSVISPDSRNLRSLRTPSPCALSNPAQNLKFEGGAPPQKGSPAKRPGEPLRVAAQYIQKIPENNGLFGIWLAEFGGKPGFYGRRKIVIGGAAGRAVASMVV